MDKHSGQGLVEYALVIVTIVIVVLMLVGAPGKWASGVYSGVSSGIEVGP